MADHAAKSKFWTVPEEPPTPPSRRSTLVGRYTLFLDRNKRAVALFWFLVMAAGYYGMSRVFPALVLRIGAVPGDSNDVAHMAVDVHYPGAELAQTTVVLLTSYAANITTSAPARAGAAQLTAFGQSYIDSGLLLPGSGESYWTYADGGLASSPLARSLVSPAGDATIILFTTHDGYHVSDAFKAFLKDLRALAARIEAQGGGESDAAVTGNLALLNDGNVALLMDAAISDAITLFLAFGLLALATRSFRFMGLALVGLAVAAGASFLLTWALTTAIETPNFAVSVILSTLFALCLDYSLFLLTHLRASLARGEAMEAAVEAMLASSGHTVLVSGSTLCACFLILAILPVNALRAPGISTTFAVACSVLVQLSLTPALLLSFPAFFAADCVDGGSLRKYPRMRALERRSDAASDALWGGVAWLARTYKFSVTLLLLALLIAPFAWRLPHFEVSQSYRNLVQKHAAAADAVYDIEARFGAGSLSSPALLGVSRGGGVLSTSFFLAAEAAVNATIGAGAPGVLSPIDLSGLAWPPADAAAVAAAVAASSSCPSTAGACLAACPPAACVVHLSAVSTLSPDGDAMLIHFDAHIDPQSDDGVAWAQRVRDALASLGAQPGAAADWLLVVEPSPDTVNYIYRKLPLLLGVTTAVIVAILLLFFRSISIAVRAVATLAVMEVCVWGAATGIYVDGVLGSGGVLHTFTSEYGLFFMMPILSFSLITGLGLDYDVFLLTAIMEEREAGWSDQDAISVGLLRSGPVISIAGVIMAIAFGGFLFSPIPLLNQLGLFVVLAVLVDTFVVCPLLVPAIMAILGPLNFYPFRSLPVTKEPFDLSAFMAAANKEVQPLDLC